jgi:DNA repair protein RadD
MTLTLRPYQDDAIAAIMGFWAQGGGNPLVEMATGTGKSAVIGTLTRQLVETYQGRVLMLVHVRELVAQNHMALLRVWPGAPAGIYSAGLGRRDAHHRVTFASIQSVHRKAKELGHRDVILIDECFPDGTPVLTPFGETPIQQIKPGQLVANAMGFGVVRACRARTVQSLIKLELSNGDVIRVTDRHPFFTIRGWKSAEELEVGTCLYRHKDVRKLRKTHASLGQNRWGRGSDFSNEAGSVEQAEVLLHQMLEAEREPDAFERVALENAGYAEARRSQADSEGRQRNRPYETADAFAGPASARLGGGACHSNEDSQREWLPNLLQTGFGEPRDDDWHRVGGEHAHGQKNFGRSEERRFAELVRVARVSREECPRGRTVHNLHVSGHPSYFAHGVLVHNCHLVPSDGEGMYRRLIDELRAINPELRVAGFTATPYRLGEGRLDGDGKGGKPRLFDRTVFAYGIGEGIRDGFLSPLISKAGMAEIDVSNVARRGGEFVAGELEAASDKITAEAVAEMHRLASDRRSWLVFCSGVKHALHVRDALRASGVTAETVTGDTPLGERDAILRRFKAGDIRALTNANVLTTGFDAPNVDMVAMLRPTLSTSLYVQIVGRGTRLAAGKDNCLILDFAGNVRRHGPVDAVSVGPKRGGAGNDDGKVAVSDVRAKACPDCESLVPIAAITCQHCGHEWPRDEKPKHEAKAEATVGILSTERVKPQQEPVVGWRFYRHEKPGAPDSVRVEYTAGLMAYREWLAFEHGGYAGQKAASWWSLHGGSFPVPKTVGEALERQGELVMPATITVKPDGKYFNITGRSFPAKQERAVA